MAKYVLKKMGALIITLLITSAVIFFIFNLIPGDPAVNKLSTNATPAEIAAMRTKMGLDGPVVVRYFKWILGLFKGDFGTSFSYGTPVASLIADKVLVNGVLSVMSVLIMSAVSIPLGIYIAKHTGGFADQFFTLIGQVCMAVPPFLMGLILTLIFGVGLHFFRPGGYIAPGRNFGGFLAYMIAPALSIAIPKCAMCVRILKGNILSESVKGYATTAYSRGNDTTGLLYKHVLPNAIMPTITFIGMVFADMIASSIIVEQTFDIPGLGRLLINSISTRDYPVVEMIVLIIASGIMLVSTLTDIIHRVIDPRLKGKE